MAGHSKWANIKHKKARNDAKRGKQWSKCSRAIIVAAKIGGPDPDANLTLRYAIEEARAANMPKDTITNAIKKGAGEQGGAAFESVIYEGYAPHGVAVMLDILTDNRNRTAGDIRKIFERGGGNLGASGCVSYLFEPKGQLMVGRDVDEDALMETAVDHGAEDVVDETDHWQVLTAPPEFLAVRQAIEEAGMSVESARIEQIPTTTVTCTGDAARKVLRLLENLEDHDDVQKVHANLEVPEDEMAALEAE